MIEPITKNKAKILIVDDNPAKILAIDSIIANNNIDIHIATSGMEALRCCIKYEYAVIILDVSMPEVDGFETAQIIRQRPESKNTPIIFTTAYNQNEIDTLKGYSLGAVDYIYAPIIPEILKTKVEVFVSLYEKTAEIKRKSEELNAVNVKIEEQLAENKQLQETLLASNKELENQRELAIAENSVKSVFLAKMSHEIRTPIHSIIGFSELLKGQIQEAVAARQIGIINRSAKSLLSIINDILDMSKIESGRLEFEMVEFDPIVEMESVVDMFSYKTSEKHIQFYVFIDPKLPGTIIGDPLRLKQILINLLGNAVKFTDIGGKITLEIKLNQKSEDSCQIHFSVKDTGIGISEDKLSTLYEPFQQGSASTFRLFGGTGLGLFISSQLVEKMGSNLEVISKENEGSTFYFYIDFKIGKESKIEEITNNMEDIYIGIYYPAPEEKPNNQIECLIKYLKAIKIHYIFFDKLENDERCDIMFVASSQFGKSKILEIVMNPEIIIPKEHSVRPKYIVIMDDENINIPKEKISPLIHIIEPPLTFSKIYDSIIKIKFGKIQNTYSSIYDSHYYFSENPLLIVDDNELNLELLENILKQMGVKSEKAFDGKEAVEKVKLREYAMIFLDANMPVMDGIEAAREIAETEKKQGLKHTPLVVLTAQAMKGDRELFLSSGFDEYLSKPIETNDLFKILAKYLVKTPDVNSTENMHKNRKNNIDLLKNAEEVGIDYYSYLSLAKKFAEKMLLHIDKIEELMIIGNYYGIDQLAHQIKGVAANYRFEKIANLASELQDAASDKNLNLITTIILQIKKENQILLIQIKGESHE